MIEVVYGYVPTRGRSTNSFTSEYEAELFIRKVKENGGTVYLVRRPAAVASNSDPFAIPDVPIDPMPKVYCDPPYQGDSSPPDTGGSDYSGGGGESSGGGASGDWSSND